ncbi:MAG TPA: L-seryl-tRNA(Sec) selenium transferase [Egibacteraceae bacterium]
MSDPRARLADLPRIDALLADADDLVARHGRAPVTAALRRAVERARRRVLEEGAAVPAADALLADAAADLARRRPGPPRPVVNATGVVVHTNLGRAPLAEAARQAVAAASGYCDLEYDLAAGARGSRDARVAPLLAEAAGAQAALAVNNAAAALVLALAALAGGRGVVVSRGELVEIGGSFRLPEIMAASGARLVEVGTTNKTRARDYAAAIDHDDTVAAILVVHPSNYHITGFTEAPDLRELAALARDRGLPLLYDVGSGLLADRHEPWLAGEPSLRGGLAAGADLVLASGDKLLGGPQAGLLAGRADLVERCRRHPLARALRLDKLRIAALVATLELHLAERAHEVPVWGMLGADPAALEARARALARAVGGAVVDGASLVGGGAAPGASLPTPVVRVAAADADAVAARLREGEPPIVVRVADAALWIDLRTVAPADDEVVAGRVAAALAADA